MRFYLKNTDIFPLPNGGGLLHIATIGYGLREFVVMLDPSKDIQLDDDKGPLYIEEVVLNTVDWDSDVFANCKHIKDDNLFHDLAAFVKEHKLDRADRVANILIERGKIHWLLGGSLK